MFLITIYYMDTTVLNPAQQRILHMMSYIKTDEELYGLERVLSRYFAQKADEKMDILCNNGDITPETIEQWGKEHMRTTYK